MHTQACVIRVRVEHVVDRTEATDRNQMATGYIVGDRRGARAPSDATAWRAVHQVDERLLARLREVRVAATRRLPAAADTDTVMLDVDATLVDVDSEHKQGAAATFKGTFGFAPMVCTVEPVGVIGGGRLRPGNATANDAADQLAVIDEAIDTAGRPRQTLVAEVDDLVPDWAPRHPHPRDRPGNEHTLAPACGCGTTTGGATRSPSPTTPSQT